MKNKILLFTFSLFLTQLFAQVSWTKMTSLPGSGRNHAIAFSHGTKGYVMTGEGGVNATLYKDFWEYNSVTNTWTQLTSYPGAARSYGIGYVIGDKAYIGLGHSSTTYLTDWWQYDFTTSTWSSKAAFPAAGRDHPGCAVMNGKLYVGFGDNSSGNYKDWWQYDPATNAWTSRATYPGPSMHHPVTAQDNNLIYLSEGHLSTGSGSKKFYSYNATTNTWATLADMPGPGVVAGASFFIGNGKIYSGAGITEPAGAFHQEFYGYDIAAGTWSAIATYPGLGVFGPVSFVIGNDAYVVTGMNSSGTDTKDLYKLSALVPVAEVNSLEAFNVYPNPAVSSFNIAGVSSAETIHYTMFNVGGEVIRSGDISSGNTNFSYKVEVSGLPKGIYFLKIQDEKNTTTKKVIVL
jgi:N-acetylneuraminic acid mutarotase